MRPASEGRHRAATRAAAGAPRNGDLIQVKAIVATCNYGAAIKPRSTAMPIETIIVLTGIVLAFATFAVVLMWGDAYSRTAKHQ
jgi:multisubunit Na+/H+ antiporter MnhC subunit